MTLNPQMFLISHESRKLSGQIYTNLTSPKWVKLDIRPFISIRAFVAIFIIYLRN